MQIESFRVFRDLVESQSFSKAAQMNGITQSAVSQQIRAIEGRFHVPLIERSSKRFALTREGEIFYNTSKEIINLHDSLQHQLDEIRNVISGNIRVETVYSIGLHKLPFYLRTFLKEYPNVKMQVEYKRADQIYDDVADGLCDLGLVAFPIAKKGLKVDVFSKDKLVIICSPQHPLAKMQEVELKTLGEHNFVGFEADQPTRRFLDKLFTDEGIEVKTTMEFDNIETVKQAVEINSGVSMVPRASIANELKTGSLVAVEIKGKTYERPVGILSKNNRVMAPAIKQFIKILHEHKPEN